MKKSLDRILEFLLITLMALLVFDVVWQVFTRYILRNPSSYTDELARFLLIWVGLLGAAYAHGKKMHLAIDLLPQALKGNQKLFLDVLIQLLVMLFAVMVMCIGGGRLVYITLYLEQYSPSLQVPLGFIYMIIPVSGVLMIYYGCYHILYPDREI